jgi:hypothetical protein
VRSLTATVQLIFHQTGEGRTNFEICELFLRDIATDAAWNTMSENHSNSNFRLELTEALEIFAEIYEEKTDQLALFRLKQEEDVDSG